MEGRREGIGQGGDVLGSGVRGIALAIELLVAQPPAGAGILGPRPAVSEARFRAEALARA